MVRLLTVMAVYAAILLCFITPLAQSVSFNPWSNTKPDNGQLLLSSPARC